MDKEQLLLRTRNFVKELFTGEGTGHDFFHVERVVRLALRFAKEEKADLFLVELAAWLHDLGDYKLHGGVDRSKELISGFLEGEGVSSLVQLKVVEIVSQVSFSKGKKASSLEAKIVQDADRLDAIGAIGLSRVFAYGGKMNREIWNPEKPTETSIQHFYDKLLKVKSKLNTSSAKKIAEERHLFLEVFLNRFYKEWKGEA